TCAGSWGASCRSPCLLLTRPGRRISVPAPRERPRLQRAVGSPWSGPTTPEAGRDPAAAGATAAPTVVRPVGVTVEVTAEGAVAATEVTAGAAAEEAAENERGRGRSQYRAGTAGACGAAVAGLPACRGAEAAGIHAAGLALPG